jgi:hypothetical protein
LLWIDSFTGLAADAEYDENLKAIPITVNAAAIAGELQRAYGSQLLECDPRSAQFPTVSVVRKALDALVSVKLAMPLPKRTGEYRVLYRQFKDDVFLHLASMLTTPAEKVTTQAHLPFDDTTTIIPSAPKEHEARLAKTPNPKAEKPKSPKLKAKTPRSSKKNRSRIR